MKQTNRLPQLLVFRIRWAYFPCVFSPENGFQTDIISQSLMETLQTGSDDKPNTNVVEMWFLMTDPYRKFFPELFGSVTRFVLVRNVSMRGFSCYHSMNFLLLDRCLEHQEVGHIICCKWSQWCEKQLPILGTFQYRVVPWYVASMLLIWYNISAAKI